MKKILTFLTTLTAPIASTFLAALFFLSHPVIAFAQNTPNNFDQFNPLVIDNSPHLDAFKTPGSFLTRVMVFAIPIAGIILFVMLIWGGFEILGGATSAKSKDVGKQRVTAAITGFILLFASYWLIQIIQVIFGVRILY